MIGMILNKQKVVKLVVNRYKTNTKQFVRDNDSNDDESKNVAMVMILIVIIVLREKMIVPLICFVIS
jgi:hypothetical protein